MKRYRVVLDPAAVDDIAAIRDHVAGAASRTLADGFVSRLLDHVDGFALAPRRGTARDDLRPGLRVVGWRRAVTIAFWVEEASDTVTILAVLYRGRDVAAALAARD